MDDENVEFNINSKWAVNSDGHLFIIAEDGNSYDAGVILKMNVKKGEFEGCMRFTVDSGEDIILKAQNVVSSDQYLQLNGYKNNAEELKSNCCL